VPDNIVELLKQMHEGSTARIRLDGELSRYIKLASGLKQGCGGAPCLFDIFFGAVLWVIGERLKEAGIQYRITFGGHTCNDMTEVIVMLREFLFADDAAFVALTQGDAQKIISVVDRTCTEFGMELSKSKTEVMLQQPRKDYKLPEPKIYLEARNGERTMLKVVDEFRYLGVIISNDNTAKKDIARRISLAAAAFAKYRRTFVNRFVSLKRKVALYRIMVETVLLQCIGVRCLLKEDVEKLEAFHYRKLRSLCGWSKVDFKSYIDVYERTGCFSVDTLISKARILWAGRVYQLDNHRAPKLLVMRKRIIKVLDHQTFNATPHKTWYKCLLEDLKHFQVDMEKVMCVKKGDLRVLVEEGMKGNEDRVRSERVNRSERRYTRGVEVGEKKVRAQHQMIANRLQLGTKNTKDKKRKTKNTQK
jgi:hypothetical protein